MTEILFTNSLGFAETGMAWQGWFTLAVVILTLFALILELIGADVILLLGGIVLTLSGILSPEDFLDGFSRTIILTLAMLFIVVRTLEINGLLNALARYVLPKSKNKARQLLTMMIPLSVSSAFLNNTPIVLMLTPVIKRWATENNDAPSKFLIPLSYATILGGACTLIGTSSNLVVYGLLTAKFPEISFGFFELAWIGIPCAIAGLLYLAFIGHRLLPERIDSTSSVMNQTKEFTSEFLVTDNCPLIGQSIINLSPKYFHDELLIEIERGRQRIESPSPHEVISLGDRLVFAGDLHHIASLHTIENLKSLADPHFKLDVTSPHFSEVVISTTSTLVGRTLKRSNFRTNYNASVMAIYRQGVRLSGQIGSVSLQAGDSLMVLSNNVWKKEPFYNDDFYYITYNEKLPISHPYRALFVVAILASMVIAATSGIPMAYASLATVFLYGVTGCISIQEMKKCIHWNLLLLIACAFAFGKAIEKTELANHIAQTVLPFVGENPRLLIGTIFLLTMVITEMITNNAATVLVFPIAIQVAEYSGFTSPEAMKAIAITVALAAAASFITPIGYQTNTIVYGPGGYKFSDYSKVGFPLSVIVFTIAVTLIPIIWPLV